MLFTIEITLHPSTLNFKPPVHVGFVAVNVELG